jgi:hypothetical protein
MPLSRLAAIAASSALGGARRAPAGTPASLFSRKQGGPRNRPGSKVCLVSGLIEPDLLQVHLEGLVNAVVLYLLGGVRKERLPVGLDDDA